MTSDRLLPQAGDRWRHYKPTHDGKDYIANIIGIATYSKRYWNIEEKVVLYATELAPVIHEIATRFDFVVQHTESKACFAVKASQTSQSGDWLLVPAGPFLGTTREPREPIAWARPLSNFLEILGDEGTWFYRFEKIQ
jgi:hypothetical protein